MDIFTKSSMTDVDVSYSGRPFGGIATICKHNDNFKYQELDVACDRIIAISIVDQQGKPVQTVFNVYLPFYNGDMNQTDLYVDTIDQLQSCIDKYGSMAPFQIIGDFNVQLPKEFKLNPRWYKGRGFNRHGSIMYEFLTGNELILADFMFPQEVSYTYFCDKINVHTWIDHIAVCSYNKNSIAYCKIINHEPGNVSDHLPISVGVKIPRSVISKEAATQKSSREFKPRPNWDKIGVKERYASHLQVLLEDIPVLSSISADANSIDVYVTQINTALHTAAKEAGGTTGKCFKPKPYWCPELSQLRNRKRFWWSIWVDNGRPRSGTVFECYKGIKKLFRKVSRRKANEIASSKFQFIDSLFNERKLKIFWNKINIGKKRKPNTALEAQALANYYASTMTDTDDLTDEQMRISSEVALLFKENEASNQYHKCFTDKDIDNIIKTLKLNVSCGIDGVSPEHFKFGNSYLLRRHLLALYNTMFLKTIVPSLLNIGLIIPILKKPSLNPNEPSNFRPITISSTHCKLIELLMMPDDHAHSNQFGFRRGRSTAFPCSFLFDITLDHTRQGSPLFICSLDAEKCFDTIWHDALFFKLYSQIPIAHWLLLKQWYSKLMSLVSFNNNESNMFSVTRGTKQGSVLSPQLFNVFLNDLLKRLSECQAGVRMGNTLFNSFAYADDVSVFASTIPGLQQLVDICYEYAQTWRFKFGILKTKCMTAGKQILNSVPQFLLGANHIDNVHSLDILGVTICSDLNIAKHIEKRFQACRKSMYNLSSVGYSNTGLSAQTKSYLWKAVGLPTLTYGTETQYINNVCMRKIESTQASNIKYAMGIPKRNHSSHLLSALRIPSIQKVVERNTVSLWHRIFQLPSCAKELNAYFLARFILSGHVHKESLLGRVIKSGFSPVRLLFNKPNYTFLNTTSCGIVDSLRGLIMHEHFFKPYSDEHVLGVLLTKAF